MNAQQTSVSAPYVVVGVDGSDGSREALKWAYEYAHTSAKGVHAVHVWNYPVEQSLAGVYLLPNIDIGADALAILREIVVSELGSEAASRVRLEAPCGVPGPLLAERSVGAELLVVGASGANPLTRLLIGSTSAHVVRHAACPVLVWRPVHAAPVAVVIAEPAAVAELSEHDDGDRGRPDSPEHTMPASAPS